MQSPSNSRRTSLQNQIKNKVSQNYAFHERWQSNTRNSAKENKEIGVINTLATRQENPLIKSYTTVRTQPQIRISQISKQALIINSEYNMGVTPIHRVVTAKLSNALYLLHSFINKCIAIQQKEVLHQFDIIDWSLDFEGKLQIKDHNRLVYGQKIISQLVIVDHIIENVNKICVGKIFQDFHAFFKRAQNKNKCDFKYTLSLIESYCKCSKIVLPKNFDFVESQEFLKPQGISSPSRTISSIGNSKSSNQRVKTIEDFQSESIPKFIQGSKSQQKLNPKHIRQTKQTKKSADISQKYNVKEYLSKMTKSNQIQKQYSFAMNVSSNELKNDKESLSSTNYKTNSFKSSKRIQDFQSRRLSQNPRSINQLPQIKKTDSFNFNITKQVHCSLQKNLEQVESQSQNSDNEKQELQKKIFENNQWVKKFDGLFGQSKDVKQSFIEGKDQVIDNRGINPENLGKLARAVVQSFLNPQHSSRKKE